MLRFSSTAYGLSRLLALFSVFGECLWCSTEIDSGVNSKREFVDIIADGKTLEAFRRLNDVVLPPKKTAGVIISLGSFESKHETIH